MDELHNNLKGMATPIIYQPIDNADERTKSFANSGVCS